MGNRAIITKHPYDENNVGVYVHWNGGIPSVTGFLRAAKRLGYRDVQSDEQYGIARLIQAIGLFFGGECSLGVDVCRHLDDSDNGVYTINENWEIETHRGEKPRELTTDEDDIANAVADTIVTRTQAAEGI